MMGAKQMKFCGAVARALLIGVKFGELNGARIVSGSKMGKLQRITHYGQAMGICGIIQPNQKQLQSEGDCMSQVLLQVRIDRGLKEQTASIYNAIGIDLPTAIRMFFKRSVMVGGLPFEGRLITRDNEAQRAFASMRQKIESAQEDEPTIDEINEYISSVRRNRRQAESVAR